MSRIGRLLEDRIKIEDIKVGQKVVITDKESGKVVKEYTITQDDFKDGGFALVTIRTKFPEYGSEQYSYSIK